MSWCVLCIINRQISAWFPTRWSPAACLPRNISHNLPNRLFSHVHRSSIGTSSNVRSTCLLHPWKAENTFQATFKLIQEFMWNFPAHVGFLLYISNLHNAGRNVCYSILHKRVANVHRIGLWKRRRICTWFVFSRCRTKGKEKMYTYFSWVCSFE